MNRQPTHPGEVLAKEFLNIQRGSYTITAGMLAARTGLQLSYVYALIDGQERVTAEVAEKLGDVNTGLGTTPAFWLNLQAAYDAHEEQAKKAP